uniref:Ycf54 n=1 Tax=Anunuuluaehu liula TaxID=3049639 RepID=UPI0030016009
MPHYYFAVASQNFLLKEEPIEEILRERTNYYKSINKDIDFWLVTNPTFINLPKFESIKTQLIHPAAAIISLDKQFIQWLKLRIGFVAIGNFESESLKIC